MGKWFRFIVVVLAPRHEGRESPRVWASCLEGVAGRGEPVDAAAKPGGKPEVFIKLTLDVMADGEGE